MQLKKLKSIGHNVSHSYLSALSLIGDNYTCTIIHRLAVKNGLQELELDMLHPAIHPVQDADVEKSLLKFYERLLELLHREGIPVEAIKSLAVV